MSNYPRANPGEPFVPSARGWNAAMAAAEANDASQRRQTTAQEFAGINTGVVLVQNNSGAARDRFDILGITGSLITPASNLPEFQARYPLVGGVPECRNWCVLLEPVPDGGIGRAVISGVTPVRVNVTDEDHGFVIGDNDATALASANNGPGQILWKESGTGAKWAVVRISNDATGGPWRQARRCDTNALADHWALTAVVAAMLPVFKKSGVCYYWDDEDVPYPGCEAEELGQVEQFPTCDGCANAYVQLLQCADNEPSGIWLHEDAVAAGTTYKVSAAACAYAPDPLPASTASTSIPSGATLLEDAPTVTDCEDETCGDALWYEARLCSDNELADIYVAVEDVGAMLFFAYEGTCYYINITDTPVGSVGMEDVVLTPGDVSVRTSCEECGDNDGCPDNCTSAEATSGTEATSEEAEAAALAAITAIAEAACGCSQWYWCVEPTYDTSGAESEWVSTAKACYGCCRELDTFEGIVTGESGGGVYTVKVLPSGGDDEGAGCTTTFTAQEVNGFVNIQAGMKVLVRSYQCGAEPLRYRIYNPGRGVVSGCNLLPNVSSPDVADDTSWDIGDDGGCVQISMEMRRYDGAIGDSPEGDKLPAVFSRVFTIDSNGNIVNISGETKREFGEIKQVVEIVQTDANVLEQVRRRAIFLAIEGGLPTPEEILEAGECVTEAE